MAALAKGSEFYGPDGQGYRMTRDICIGDFIYATDIEAIGGAPEPKPGKQLPVWFARQIGMA